MLSANERRDFIYRYVHENQLASYNDLAELTNVSHMTIRRDVQILEREGKIIRVNGGIQLSALLSQELPWQDKSYLNHKIKKELGKFAFSRISEGTIVYLDAGTTTFEIACSIPDNFSVTVVTNDFSISRVLMNKPGVDLFHVGGKVDKRNYSCVGLSAANFIKAQNIDLAFLSTSSWDLKHGISTPYEGKAIVKQTVISVANRNILVSDSSKYGKYGFYTACPLSSVDEIITDSISGECKKSLKDIDSPRITFVDIF
ncbi:DeoR/GlpR family DNA-binding transcription regulator [Citrobacter sp. JGM124]|uniref:DeoR/GlpR family DNA-binding transcription regulator n=1 Tax=Citrobacter sp. JGM124 TaxID=2799789 RepID=UPI001BADCDAD|nr:DeoR/GlpR family DNA-binding transcription regulator [Citrobacter sp. JGM124]MBS0849539.1 DeoR/GlpR transcriptional regulator [Citrobacter sp. JGM124]